MQYLHGETTMIEHVASVIMNKLQLANTSDNYCHCIAILHSHVETTNCD